jgi:crossover junction endodeoxyribonuclease RuvC
MIYKQPGGDISEDDGRSKTLRILAIDPGTELIGYADLEEGILLDFGVKEIRTTRTPQATLERLDDLFRRLMLEKQPGIVVIERTQFSQANQNLLLALMVAKIRGVARREGIPVAEYGTKTVRKLVCNDGNARRQELARVISALYPEMNNYLKVSRTRRDRYFFNVTDAIGLALAHRLRVAGPGFARFDLRIDNQSNEQKVNEQP